MNHKRILRKFMVLLFVAGMPMTLAAEEYLLTGVIAASGGGKAFAVIEQPDGQQRLVSAGDMLGEGRVEEIDSVKKTVRLAFPEGQILLGLTGSAHPVEYVAEYSIEDYQEVEAATKDLDEKTVQGLLALSANAQKQGEAKAKARVNELLGLSAGATIAAFDEKQVDSTLGLLQQMAPVLDERQLVGGHLGTISVTDTVGRRRIYLGVESPVN